MILSSIFFILTVHHTLATDLVNNNILLSETNLENIVADSSLISDKDGHEKVLSRRKRFIIFPEGSSLQLAVADRVCINRYENVEETLRIELKDARFSMADIHAYLVFCNTFPNINVIGDIVLWGYTAALAYELPQDPYSPFMHHADPLHRRIDTKAIYYTDEDGKIIYKRPYQRKFIVNPAFAKRSVDGATIKAGKLKKGIREKFKIDRKQMHASKNKREFLKREHMDGRSVEFHRSSRGVLYQKIETMLQGVGANGRQCLLKTLCLVGQSQQHPQGAFLDEILRAVFTLPKSDTASDYKEYDAALAATESCDDLYPECEQNFEDTDSSTDTMYS